MKLLDIPFQSNVDFRKCGTLAANGIYAVGSALSDGIKDKIEIINGSCRMNLDSTNDASTLGWKRTEIDFGNFPTAKGEYWTSFDFMKSWTHTGYVVIGSWSALINGVSGTTYVPIGIRIRNGQLLIQTPLDDFSIGFSNQTVCRVGIDTGKWYSLVIHVNLQSDTTGFREVFLNGRSVLKQYNIQTTYTDADAHYFKTGPYDGDHDGSAQVATLHIANVKVWQGNVGYKEVLGGVPKSIWIY